MAEDEIVSAPVDIEIGEAEALGVNGLFCEKESVLYNEAPSIKSEITNSILANEDSDFVIDEEGVLSRYRGFEKNVVIPNGVKIIGQEAFAGDEIMESVSIPDSVTYIGFGAFSGCTKLKEITIPNSVTDTNQNVLSGCTSLTKVQFSNQLKSVNWGFCMDCHSLKIIEIPNTIESIDTHAFLRCDSIETVVIPNSIKYIGYGAFSQCNSLKKIIIPNSVQTIDENAFSSCHNLEEITIPESVTIINRTAFNDSNNVVIRGMTGTYAERYADALGIPFNAPVILSDEKGDYGEYDESTFEYVNYLIVYINHARSIKVKQSPADLATTLKWASSDTSIATVDQNGVVTGIRPGNAIITAGTADGKGKATQVNIIVPESTRIWFSDEWDEGIPFSEVKLYRTEEIYLFKETPYSEETGFEMPVTFSSSDDSTVKIEKTDKTNNGDYRIVLNFCKMGKATITATTPDNGKASFDVEVIRPDPESIKIDQKGPIHIKVGKTVALSATISPLEADQSMIKWKSYDPEVAKVNSNGVITAVAEGQTYITADIVDYYDPDRIEVYVEPDNPTKITLNKTKVTLGAKDTVTLKAKLTPADTKTKPTWKSNKPKVAKVSAKGVVTALTKGTAIITVTAENGRKATAKITVKPGPKTITLYRSGKKVKAGATLELKKGKSLALKAKLPSGTLSTLTWSSNKPSVAKVSKAGKVTALKAGTATITVRAANGTKVKVKIRVK